MPRQIISQPAAGATDREALEDGDGRDFLIEAVEFAKFQPLLNSLPVAPDPPAQQGAPPKQSGALTLPPPRREPKSSSRPMGLSGPNYLVTV